MEIFRRLSQIQAVFLIYPFLMISNFFWRRDYHILSILNGLNKGRCLHQTIHSTSIQPRKNLVLKFVLSIFPS